MQNAPRQSLDAALDALRASFLDQLDDRILRIEQAWLLRNDANPQIAQRAVQVVLEELHKIAGIAGSFGFEEIGAAAQMLETAVERGEMAGLDARINAFLDMLEDEIEPI